MKRKLFLILLIAAMLVAVLAGCTDKQDSAFTNGNFETLVEGTDGNVVEGWKTDSGAKFKFLNNAQGTDQYYANGGQRYAFISTTSKGYDYLSQAVTLKKGRYYKLSADIRIDKIDTTKEIGARVGFLEDKNFIGINLTETTDWTTQTIYFKSGTGKEVNLTIGLGNSVNKASGTVYFDNIVLEEVGSLPAGVASAGEVVPTTDLSRSDGVSTSIVVLFTIGSIVLAYCIYMVYRKLSAGPMEGKSDAGLSKAAKALSSPFAVFLYIMLGAFVVRFISLLTTYGMGSLIDDYQAIGTIAAQKGMLSVLTNEGVNQPIGVTFIMSLFGLIADKVGLESGMLGYAILVRLPAIIADIVTCYVIYMYAQKHQGEKQAAIFAALYAFIPVFFCMGALYGTMESVAISFAIGMFVCMLDNKHIAVGALYTLGLMFSNYMLLLLPIVLVYQIMAMITDKQARAKIALTMVASFVVFFAVSLPLCWSEVAKGNVFYVFKKMYAFFQSQQMTAVDSFNLYSIFGGANSLVRNTLLEVGNWLFVIAMEGLAVYNYVRTRNRLDLIMLSSLIVTAYAVLGAASNVVILPLGIALLLIYIVLVPDRRLYAIFGGLATLSFLNVIQLLSMNGYLAGRETGTEISFASKSPFLIVFSIITVAIVFFYFYVAVDVVVYESTDEIPPMERKLKDELKYVFGFGWVKKR